MKSWVVAIVSCTAGNVLCGTAICDTTVAKTSELASALKVLKESNDPRELEKEAIWLCFCGEPGAIATLKAQLIDRAFLDRLSGSMQDPFRNVRVERILTSLCKGAPLQAEETLIHLGNSKVFAAEAGRMFQLIRATRHVEKATSSLIMFLDSQALPDSASTNLVIMSLAHLQTPESRAGIKKRFLASEYRNEQKLAWCTYLLPVRDEPSIIRLYEELITAGVSDAAIRNRLVQTLFEYRHSTWFKNLVNTYSAPMEPSNRNSAGSEALRDLLRVSDIAMKMDLTVETKEGLKVARKEIESILTSRLPKK